MAWFRRTEKLIVQAFRALPSTSTSRLPSHNSIFQPNSRISRSRYFNFATKGGPYNRFSQRIGTSGFEINNNFRRFYSVYPKNVWHFMPRGAKDWFQDPKNVSLVLFGVVGSGVLITVCLQNMETIPYTNRTHVILVSNAMEKKLGDCVFEKMKADFKNELLPATHPQSVRVGMIANNILDAMKKTLNKETERSDLGYGSENEGKVEGNWQMEDEKLDDKWVKKGKEQDSQPYTSHLDGLNWEILVVNKPFVDAFCLPGGKIVVFTGLLEHFSSDAEIATFIGREVGHVVARHSAEQFTHNQWFSELRHSSDNNRLSSLFFWRPFGERMEKEADYIGLLLVASAGYDPRVAPTVLEKFIDRDSMLTDYRSTQHRPHISKAEAEAKYKAVLHAHAEEKKRAELLFQAQVRKRAESLAKAQVMDEALTIYENVRA